MALGRRGTACQEFALYNTFLLTETRPDQVVRKCSSSALSLQIVLYSPATPSSTVLDKLMVPQSVNPLTPELNPSAQRCLTRYFTGDFAS
jgi:hypothetical protein